MKEINKCPFCGCNDHRVGIRRQGNKGYKVICGRCGAGGPYVAIKDWHDNKMIAQNQAIQGWNTRKPIERIIEQIEKLKSNLGFGGTIQTMYSDGKLTQAIELIKGGGEDV